VKKNHLCTKNIMQL